MNVDRKGDLVGTEDVRLGDHAVAVADRDALLQSTHLVEAPEVVGDAGDLRLEEVLPRLLDRDVMVAIGADGGVPGLACPSGDEPVGAVLLEGRLDEEGAGGRVAEHDEIPPVCDSSKLRAASRIEEFRS